MQEISKLIQSVVKELFNVDVEVVLTRPAEQFGDYATNVALQLSKQLDKNPREIAQAIADALQHEYITGVEIAGPGFINIRLTDSFLWSMITTAPSEQLKGKSIVAEYSDPNPFKALHAGHLYTSLVGDAIARLMEHAGATVHRVNFGGDVGMHVGKAMWSIIQEFGGENPEGLASVPGAERPEWISKLYVKGNTAYEEDEAAKQEIIAVNKRVYELHANGDKDSGFAQIYWTCRQWSYDGFDVLYKQLEMVPFEKYYPESAVADKGLAVVKEHTGTVYKESEGAVVFKGEDHGLFTQVFINSEGLPTYAAKDVGLIYHKYEDFKPDQSFIITDISQKDHLAVVMKSISEFAPDLVAATRHFTHGRIKFAGGRKMSSRKGDVLMAADVLGAVAEAGQQSGRPNPSAELAAVKYSFIKTRIGGDIVYDPEESVSLEGNSGPYLQYAHARACSILAKAPEQPGAVNSFEQGERSLVRKLSEYKETIDISTRELLPHYICTYLYELAQTFNRFYEKNRVIGDARQAERLTLVTAYADVLNDGLTLLGIHAPDRM